MQNWVKIRNYKCFGDEPQGFEEIKTFNVIIGRNNSGKSSLLDLVQFLTKPQPFTTTRSARRPEVLRKGRFDQKDHAAVFPSGTSWSDIGSIDSYGMRFINKAMTWRITDRGNNEFIGIEGPEVHNRFQSTMASSKVNPLRGAAFQRLSAERDVRAEQHDDTIALGPNGNGATNIIQHYLNDRDRPSELIEHDLLASLNEVFEPDDAFERIRVQRLNDGRWEVFLDEAGKGSIALSDSGSGLKTVLLVLLLTVVVPHLQNKALADYVLAFEELENNAHPALQRRLLLFLHRLAISSRVTVFLTTHSTVAIDFFSRDNDSQIIHVTHDRHVSRVEHVTAYETNRAILDDLDIRASDMLQSNGLVWLEGPSDRLYFRRWVDLWSGGRLIEGVHYQCLFYGGKLLRHISCDEPKCDPSRVEVLTVNRNAMILIDSDLREQNMPLPKTKARIVEEMARVGGLVWVTAGKEIENYIPESVLSRAVGIDVPPVVSTSTVWDVVNATETGRGNKLKRDKIGLAEVVVPMLTVENLTGRLDIAETLPKLCTQIARWNGIRL